MINILSCVGVFFASIRQIINETLYAIANSRLAYTELNDLVFLYNDKSKVGSGDLRYTHGLFFS